MAIIEKKKSKLETRFVVILMIVALIVVVISVLTMGNLFSRTGKEAANLMRVPVVSTTIMSTDGEIHNVHATFYLEVEGKNLSKLDTAAIHTKINDTLSSMDFDTLTEEDGKEQMKQAVKDGLKDYIGEKNLTNIYLTDFESGELAMEADEAAKPRNATRDARLKGMFKKMN